MGYRIKILFILLRGQIGHKMKLIDARSSFALFILPIRRHFCLNGHTIESKLRYTIIKRKSIVKALLVKKTLHHNITSFFNNEYRSELFIYICDIGLNL